MRAAGVALTPRQAYYQAMVDCDLTFLSVQAAVAGGGLSTAALARGIAAAEPRFPYAATFGGTSNPALIDKVGAFRDLGFVTSCGCFQYLSSYSRSV